MESQQLFHFCWFELSTYQILGFEPVGKAFRTLPSNVIQLNKTKHLLTFFGKAVCTTLNELLDTVPTLRQQSLDILRFFGEGPQNLVVRPNAIKKCYLCATPIPMAQVSARYTDITKFNLIERNLICALYSLLEMIKGNKESRQQ